MSKQIVSIIVPVYNVENYLKRCIESIINQTYNHLEIILVDDGSTDNSGAICDEYSQKDSRIRVIHKENGGLSSARNAGLDICTGEYVSFIDSDDFVSASFVEQMLNLLLTNDCDIVKCSFVRGTNNRFNGEDTEKSAIVTLLGREATYNSQYSVIACDKLYKISLFYDIRFPLVKKCEDEATYYKLAYAAKKVCITKRALYYYFMSENSIMRNNREQDFSFMSIYRDRIKFFSNKGENKLCDMSYCKYLLILLYEYSVSIYLKSNKENSDMLRMEIKRVTSYILNSKYTTIMFKVLSILVLLLPSICSYLIFKLKVRK